ncbi:MAG: amidase [Acidimicrobiia bacterium]|nr:amidase [Acidimicrobiia bacterium]
MTAVSRAQEALQSAHASQPRINAFTLVEDGEALAAAEKVDALINSGRYAGPLAGVPIAVKDLIDHEGRVTTCGSAFYREEATTSATCISRLERAGATIIGRTGLHEWAFGFSSENPHFGPVRNPWDPSTSPGGSSGGSGAAVAAGITPIAIGTDTGGSVRVPAALCGVFGLKVTHGRVPLDGVFPLVPSADTVGPIANSVDGIDLAYRTMSGDDTPQPEPGPMTVGVPAPWTDEAPMESEIGDAFEATIASLSDVGHRVVPIRLEGAIPNRNLVYSIADEVTAIHREFRAAGKPYGEDVARRLDEAEGVTESQKKEASDWRLMIKERFGDAFTRVDLLVTPTVPARRKAIGEEMIGGRHHRAVLSYFTALVNQALHPAIAMPLARSGSPPASLQAIGPMGSEAQLIGFARGLESEGVVGFSPPPESSTITGDG